MFTWVDYLYENERLEDMRRKAAQARLVRQAFPRRAASMRLFPRALVWVGHRLTAWGGRLTEQYGGIPDRAAPTCGVETAG